MAAGTLQFKLIDLDLAGHAGEVKYPKFIDRTTSLKRPPDVEDGRVILADQDESMLGYVFEYSL